MTTICPRETSIFLFLKLSQMLENQHFNMQQDYKEKLISASFQTLMKHLVQTVIKEALIYKCPQKRWTFEQLLEEVKAFESTKKVREKSRECRNYKPQPFPDPKRKRKPPNLNKHKPNKRAKSTKISSLFPKRGNRNTKRTEKHKNKMTHEKTYNKSPRRINHKATNNMTNTGTTALERSVEQTTGGV